MVSLCVTHAQCLNGLRQKLQRGWGRGICPLYSIRNYLLRFRWISEVDILVQQRISTVPWKILLQHSHACSEKNKLHIPLNFLPCYKHFCLSKGGFKPSFRKAGGNDLNFPQVLHKRIPESWFIPLLCTQEMNKRIYWNLHLFDQQETMLFIFNVRNHTNMFIACSRYPSYRDANGKSGTTYCGKPVCVCSTRTIPQRSQDRSPKGAEGEDHVLI